MHRRSALAPLLLALLAAACGGPRGGDARSSSSVPPDPTVSLDWLKARPYQTPWGPGEIPATKKPRWFCFTDVARPENSLCDHTEADCEAARARGKCEPHARAACDAGLGACYPTVAICEAVRAAASRDQAPNRAQPIEPGAPCAWQD